VEPFLEVERCRSRTLRMLLQLSASRQLQLQSRSRAAMLPSITDAAPVTWLDASQVRSSTPFAISCTCSAVPNIIRVSAASLGSIGPLRLPIR
jgi:hypothetical protein